MTILRGELLASIPNGLRAELLTAYQAIMRNYRERRWEPSELNGGKFCEIIYSIINGYMTGTFPAKASKPSNMVDACRALEAHGTHPRSLRIQIPRMLMALYEIRNNRGVGHVGGDVDPNQMDATCVVEMSKWLLSELVRVFHNVTVDDASSAVSGIVERTSPLVWEVGGRRRVLDTSLGMLDRVLVLLYNHAGTIPEKTLFQWAEHSHLTVFRRDILAKAHKRAFLDFDRVSGGVTLSPKGSAYVEESILDKATQEAS
jgi:hypothetical protein